jgi:hypothetical protein
MCKCYVGIAMLIVRLFENTPKVHTTSIQPQVGDATGSVGLSHSSDESFVMREERRAWVIQSNYF